MPDDLPLLRSAHSYINFFSRYIRLKASNCPYRNPNTLTFSKILQTTHAPTLSSLYTLSDKAKLQTITSIQYTLSKREEDDHHTGNDAQDCSDDISCKERKNTMVFVCRLEH